MTYDADMEDLDGDGTDISLTDLLEQQLEVTLQAMTGPMLGQVDTYDAASARASITPLIPLLVDGEVVPSPKMPSVPVLWPGHGDFRYTWPVAAGAIMQLLPLGHDHSRWMSSGTANIAPTDDRRFSLSDLVALPLAPSPIAAPPSPTSHDPAWAVLYGQHKIGSNAASLAVALDTDQVIRGPWTGGDVMSWWMFQVEVAINTAWPGSINPLSTTFNQVGLIRATSTKIKGE